VDTGPNKPTTFDWLVSRTRDGSGRSAPRELIHLLTEARDVQLQRLERGEREPDEAFLFDRLVFKEALEPVSRTRFTQTLVAEYPDLKKWLDPLKGQKTAQNPATLAKIWAISEEEARGRANSLVKVGFFEERGGGTDTSYRVPFLYRDALEMVQGTAE